MTQNLIAASRLNSLIHTRMHDRSYLVELLAERQECLLCGVVPFGTDATLSHRLRLLGGMAAAW